MSEPQRPLRILHLTAGSDAGGLSRYLLDLCAATVARGHEVVLAGQRGAWHDQFERSGWPWVDLPLKGGPIGFWRSARKLRKAITDQRFDVIHSHYRRATLLGRKVQQAGQPPLLYTLHLSHMPMGGFSGWFNDFGDHVHAPSEDGRRWLVEDTHFPAERVTVIPHGINTHRFPQVTPDLRIAARAALRLADDALVAAYVGRLDYPKNVDWLIDLAATTRDRFAKLVLLLAGDGPDEAVLRRQAERYELEDRVRFLGHRDPLPIYHAADLLLLPSLREGFSLACAEAMCAGIPVVRTNTSGTAELIVDGETGISTPIDKDAFTAAAILMLDDAALRTETGPAAAAHVRANFPFDRQVEETIALYKRLTATGNSSA